MPMQILSQFSLPESTGNIMTGAMPFRQALTLVHWQKYILSNMKHAHFMKIYFVLLSEYRVQGRPNSILQVSTLFFIKKETKKQKDGTRTGRQDVNVHLPSVFKSSIIWVLD